MVCRVKKNAFRLSQFSCALLRLNDPIKAKISHFAEHAYVSSTFGRVLQIEALQSHDRKEEKQVKSEGGEPALWAGRTRAKQMTESNCTNLIQKTIESSALTEQYRRRKHNKRNKSINTSLSLSSFSHSHNHC